MRYTEVKADAEEIYSVINNSVITVTPINYSSEWLTTTCVDSIYAEINSCVDDFNSLVESIKSYATGLENISSVNPPDIDNSVDNKYTKINRELK